MYFKDINPYKKYELIKTLHSLSLMEFQFSKRKKKKTQNHVWLNEKMIVMADWGKLKTMLIYIKAANYTRQDRALRSPNEGKVWWGDVPREVRQIAQMKWKKKLEKILLGSCYARRARASTWPCFLVSHFVSTCGHTTLNTLDLILFCSPKMNSWESR